jgi:HAMP domain-containing protein
LDAQIDVSRKDEIGELAEAVSRMQVSLQAAIERLRARRTAG